MYELIFTCSSLFGVGRYSADEKKQKCGWQNSHKTFDIQSVLPAKFVWQWWHRTCECNQNISDLIYGPCQQKEPSQSYLSNQEPKTGQCNLETQGITKHDWPEKMKKVNKSFLMILCHIHRSHKFTKGFLWQEQETNAENPKPDNTTNMSKLEVSVEAFPSQLRESHGRRGRMIVRIRGNEVHSDLHSFNYVFILKISAYISHHSTSTIYFMPWIKLCIVTLISPLSCGKHIEENFFSNIFL